MCRFGIGTAGSPAASAPPEHATSTTSFPGRPGTTDEANLACLCRHHHRIKTHTAWTVRRLPGNILEWTSPTGRVYLSTLEDP